MSADFNRSSIRLIDIQCYGGYICDMVVPFIAKCIYIYIEINVHVNFFVCSHF